MERRTIPRKTCHLNVAYRGPNVTGQGVITNLSNVGCSVAGLREVEIPCYLTLTIPLSDASPCSVGGGVRWRRGRQIGVEFLMLSKEDQVRLTRSVTTTESP